MKKDLVSIFKKCKKVLTRKELKILKKRVRKNKGSKSEFMLSISKKTSF